MTETSVLAEPPVSGSGRFPFLRSCFFRNDFNDCRDAGPTGDGYERVSWAHGVVTSTGVHRCRAARLDDPTSYPRL
jgi:hypothetical protein